MPRKEPLYPHVSKSKIPDNIYEGGAPPSAYSADLLEIAVYSAEIAQRKREATALLEIAVGEIRSGNYEGALWRAVDAAGLMSFFVHRYAVGMPPSPTGRGFFINKKM